jgi:glycosyltransferase involved in cell wall biosynthesis
MNQVKIVHITTVDLTIYYLMLNQLLDLQKAGYKVLGISSPGPNTSSIEAAGIRHISVSMTRKISPLADIVSLWRLFRIIRSERFVIVHTHNPKAGLLGQIAARMAGVPIVVNTLHGFYFHEHMHPVGRRFFMTLEKIAARFSDSILSQNKEDIQTAVDQGICPPEKIKYLGNGINLEKFDPKRFSDADRIEMKQELDIHPDAAIVGFVGRLAGRRKGFLNFLAAARRVKQRLPNVCFLILGASDPGKADSVSPSVAADYGLQDSCLFLGYRPNHELPRFYKAMNVLVLPSIFEGMPRSVIEASAMQVPVVATNVKGNREAVENGRNGLLVPLDDIQALADAIIELLTDREKARQMGEEGRRMALERFDERLVFDKVKAEYARLLQEKGFPVPKP